MANESHETEIDDDKVPEEEASSKENETPEQLKEVDLSIGTEVLVANVAIETADEKQSEEEKCSNRLTTSNVNTCCRL